MAVPAGGGAGGAEGGGRPVRRTLPEKLEYLFATVRPPGGLGREYTHQEIADRAAEAGEQVSASYVWQLRKDPTKNPTIRSLEALAKAFGIPVAYFFNDETAAAVEANLELIAALRNEHVRGVALAASDLSPESLQAIMQMIDRAREWEGLGTWEGGQDAGAETRPDHPRPNQPR